VQSNEHYLTVLRYIESPGAPGAIRNGTDKEGLKISRGPVKLPDRWNRLVNVLPGESVDDVIDAEPVQFF